MIKCVFPKTCLKITNAKIYLHVHWHIIFAQQVFVTPTQTFPPFS